MADHEKLRVLVIDDEITQRMLVKDFLEDAGHIVRQAEDGRRGLKMAEVTKPDVILLDVLLPVIDGYSVCKRFKEAPETADTPVILITGSRESHVIEKGLAAGADDFLTKPVDWAFLSDRVVNVVKKSRERAEMARQLKDRASPPSREVHADILGEFQLDDHLSQAGAKIEIDSEAFSQERQRLAAEHAEALSTAVAEAIDAKNAEIAAIHAESAKSAAALRERFERDAEILRSAARAEVRAVEARLKADVEAARAALSAAQEALDAQSGELRAQDIATAENRTIAAWRLSLRWASAQSSMASNLATDVRSALSNLDSAELQNLERAAKAMAASAAKFKIIAQAMASGSEPPETAVNVARMAEEITSQAEGIGRSRRLSISLANEAGDVQLNVDAERLRYAMLSLVSNAIRFTPAGGTIEISIGRRESDDIEMTVLDGGVGIAPTKLRDLQRCLDEPGEPGEPIGEGGLGVPAAAALARHMGGLLELESELGAGTRASLVFPRSLEVVGDSDLRLKLAG